jgi:hypothetical protein
MPKKYKEKKNEKFESELSQQELNAVRKVEDYVDDQIDLQWENGVVDVDNEIVTFNINPQNGNPTTFSEEKKNIMTALLFSKFRDDDWRIRQDTPTGTCKFFPTKV